jgi:hypothetical protein
MHVATSWFPITFPDRVQTKLKQLAKSPVWHACIPTALFFFPEFQLLIAWGISLVVAYNDHTWSLDGGSQSPVMLPPFRSARPGPGKIGQMHSAAAKGIVPVAVLTAI